MAAERIQYPCAKLIQRLLSPEEFNILVGFVNFGLASGIMVVFVIALCAIISLLLGVTLTG